MFLSSFCSKLLSHSFLQFTVGSLYIFLYFTLHSIHTSFNLYLYSIMSVSILITSVLNSASDKLTVSSPLSSFSGILIYSFIWAIFLCLGVQLFHCKGQSLKYSPGQGNPFPCVMTLNVGDGSEREQYHLLGPHPTFSHFLCYPTRKLSPAGADSWVSMFVYILGPCESLQ